MAAKKSGGSGADAERVRPVFKWPGGKFKLLDAILAELPEGKRLVEPFVGSGVVFLNSRYPEYLLGDRNADLIGFHRDLIAGGDTFIGVCRELFAGGNTAEVYYERRERFNGIGEGWERSALFLYLNRFGYNGLVRYNASGGFNVPFGRYRKPYFPEGEMRAFMTKAGVVRVEAEVMDFAETFARVGKGDVVYCDPPYFPLSATANFTTYAGNVFGVERQEQLLGCVMEAVGRGACVVISNHDVPEVRKLYKGAGELRSLSVRRSISCAKESRGMVGELLAVFRG